MSPDPTRVVLPASSRHWPEEMRRELLRSLTPAGVLVPVIDRAAELSVLLTQRSAELTHHAGQVSFPGGRMEAGDRDLLHTALRETEEEVGIDPSAVSVVGFLDPMPTMTGYAVTPVVGVIGDPGELSVDPAEVEFAFEVPLDFLLDDANQVVVERKVLGRMIPVVEFRYRQHRIWGATAHMLVQLRDKLFTGNHL